MIRRVCSKACDFLVTNGGYFLVIAILFIGTMLVAPEQLNASLMFNIAEGLALVSIALLALQTWKKAEHWKVKRDTFYFLNKMKFRISKFQADLEGCSLGLHRFIETGKYKTLDEYELSDSYKDQSKVNKIKMERHIEKVDIYLFTHELASHLLSINIKWSSTFTTDLQKKIHEVLHDEFGLNHIERAYASNNHCLDFYSSDSLDNDTVSKFAKISLSHIHLSLMALSKYNEIINEAINDIEKKLGSTINF